MKTARDRDGDRTVGRGCWSRSPVDSAQAPARRRVQFTDVTAAVRHQVHPQQRQAGQEVPARDDGLGRRVLRRRRRRLARHLPRQQPATGRRARTTIAAARSTATTGNGTFTDITAGSGLDVEMYGMGVAAADYDNDGRAGPLHHRARRGPAVPERRRRQVQGRDEGGRHRQRELRHERRVARLRQGRPRSICSSPTTCSGPQKTDLWCSLDGATKSYCTPESYKGTASKLYRNLGGGKFEDVSAKAGVADPNSKSLGVAVLDYDMRRLARHVRRQRHAAEQALSQQPQRHVHRGRHGGRRRVRRGRRGARRDGRRCGRLRPLGPPAPARRQLLEPDARPLPQRGQRTCSSTRRRARRSAAPACCRWPSASSSSTTTSTATSTSSRPTATSRRRSGACSRRCSTGSRRCCSATPASASSRTRAPPSGSQFSRPMRRARRGLRRLRPRRRPRRAVHRRTTARRGCTATTAATRTTSSPSARRGVKSNRDGIGAVVRVDERQSASSGAWCAAAPATARRATWR